MDADDRVEGGQGRPDHRLRPGWTPRSSTRCFCVVFSRSPSFGMKRPAPRSTRRACTTSGCRIRFGHRNAARARPRSCSASSGRWGHTVNPGRPGPAGAQGGRELDRRGWPAARPWGAKRQAERRRQGIGGALDSDGGPGNRLRGTCFGLAHHHRHHHSCFGGAGRIAPTDFSITISAFSKPPPAQTAGLSFLVRGPRIARNNHGSKNGISPSLSGLIPAVRPGRDLLVRCFMVGFMNDEALALTKSTGIRDVLQPGRGTRCGRRGRRRGTASR